MGNYRLTKEAEADLDRIWLYGLEHWGAAEADKYYNALFQRFEELAEAPLLYPAVDDLRKGYRRSICGVDSIYYRVHGDTVEIMSILGRQDTDEAL